jgi:transcriptional regulator with PAS, ATPase and Fis domain
MKNATSDDSDGKASGEPPSRELIISSLERLLAGIQEAHPAGIRLTLAALASAVTELRWAKGHPVRMRDIEQEVIRAALRVNHGDQKLTASQLGISLRHLQYRLRTDPRPPPIAHIRF